MKNTTPTTSSQTINLNDASVQAMLTLAKQSNSKKMELAQALTTDQTNTSTTAVDIQGTNSNASSVSYTSKDLADALQSENSATNSGILFHTHIQGLNHANVHSEQDEIQHHKNTQHYTSNSTAGEVFECLGNGIIGVRNDGGFSVKARSTTDNSLVKFSYNGQIAEELVFNKEGKLAGKNEVSSLDPSKNNTNSWSYQAV